VREYSPKRRTAVVFTGIGTTGAYHAGVLRALDESGVKIDLVVGSGAGAITAAFAAVGGGTKLYGPGGLWDGARFSSFYRLRPALHVALSLVGISFVIIALPVALGLLLGLLFPLLLIADRAAPGSATRALQALWVAPEAMSGPYLAAQAVPVFALAMVAIWCRARLYRRRRAPRGSVRVSSTPSRGCGESGGACGRSRAAWRSRPRRRATASSGAATRRCSPRTWASRASAS
jgi:hypothetical protein